MKTINVNGIEITYSGTLTDITIHEPKNLSLSERVGLIGKIIVKQREDEVLGTKKGR